MSTTGTRPVIAAPSAEPTIAASEIGAFSTRSAPNSSARPLVTPNGTPRTMSSPMQNTRVSRRISSRIARVNASAYSISTRPPIRSLAPWPVHEEVGERVLGLGERTRLGVRDGVLDLGRDLRPDSRGAPGVEQSALRQVPLEARDRIGPPSLGGLVLRAVELRIALEVPDPADRVRLDQRGPLAGARPEGRARDCRVHREDVVA